MFLIVDKSINRPKKLQEVILKQQILEGSWTVIDSPLSYVSEQCSVAKWKLFMWRKLLLNTGKSNYVLVTDRKRSIKSHPLTPCVSLCMCVFSVWPVQDTFEIRDLMIINNVAQLNKFVFVRLEGITIPATNTVGSSLHKVGKSMLCQHRHKKKWSGTYFSD